MASTLALEAAMGIVPTEQGRYLRDILHGCEFLRYNGLPYEVGPLARQWLSEELEKRSTNPGIRYAIGETDVYFCLNQIEKASYIITTQEPF